MVWMIFKPCFFLAGLGTPWVHARWKSVYSKPSQRLSRRRGEAERLGRTSAECGSSWRECQAHFPTPLEQTLHPIALTLVLILTLTANQAYLPGASSRSRLLVASVAAAGHTLPL